MQQITEPSVPTTPPVSREVASGVGNLLRVINVWHISHLSGKSQRCTYKGTWIDQLVATEVDTDHDGVTETTLYPVTDLLGSVQLLTDASGKIVERVEYDADGTPRFFSGDAVAPAVTRVAWTGDGVRPAGDAVTATVFEIGFSEWIDEASVAMASATLTADAGGATSLTVVLDSGARSAVLSGGAVVAGSGYTLRLDGLKDRGGNSMAALELPVSVVDEAVYEVLNDTVAPTVLAVMDADDGVFVVFDEPVVAEAGGSLADAVTVGRGGAVVLGSTSRVSANVVRWAATDALAWLDLGVYSVTAVGLADTSAAGNAVDATPLPVTFMHLADDVDRNLVVYEASGDSQPRAESAYGVTGLFQGRGWHQDLGLYYYRARWYHPEIVAFAERDPEGFFDSSNPYQTLGYGHANFNDPDGHTIFILWYGNGSEYNKMEGLTDLALKLVDVAKTQGKPHRLAEVIDYKNGAVRDIGRSESYADTVDDYQIYVASNTKNYPSASFKHLIDEIEASSGGTEDVYLVGHSYGVIQQKTFAKMLKDRGISVKGYIAIDQFGKFPIPSSSSVPSNVKGFLGFYSDPTSEVKAERENRKPVPQPHQPGSGKRRFSLSAATQDYGTFAMNETHQSIDNSPEVHDKILSFVAGQLSPVQKEDEPPPNYCEYGCL